jgi:NAD(P)-dependent dehydrogenase (short-subunit alcohol dehydrogenase family)
MQYMEIEMADIHLVAGRAFYRRYWSRRLLGLEHLNGVAELGATIEMIDVDESALEDAASIISERRNTLVLTRAVDISNPSAVNELVNTLVKSFGRVDVFINNAQLQFATS